jgi:glutamate racemase
VFDSGVGGLSVLRHIQALLPQESSCYVADSAHAPYGEKSPQALLLRARALCDFLQAHGAKIIVVACNTATAAAVAQLRESYTLPIIGMEPAVKPAAAATRSGVIGVLATTGTLKSAQFAALLDTWGKDIRCITQVGLGLVECVEKGEVDTPATRALLASHWAPLKAAGADTLVLGCTHYPFLRTALQEIVGPEVTLIDTGLAVAQQVVRVLNQEGLCNTDPRPATHRFWTSADPAHAQPVMSHLWGAPLELEKL